VRQTSVHFSDKLLEQTPKEEDEKETAQKLTKPSQEEHRIRDKDKSNACLTALQGKIFCEF
jgi:hypothetical protein